MDWPMRSDELHYKINKSDRQTDDRYDGDMRMQSALTSL